ncbi:rhodanese-like domain-containing protein [Sulfitobacter sabulilitoris]|uniref:Rhodanese-like domain-containing protein n=1 Tax=Sulfitobacter sabulilitoris TaxID=2562655 RepID=A0A5S3PEE0_9RHOB|nr:rhodanese-like domain-containing protein [Sulfitobacter sabulilitoris]TMM52319.1 rhodanese-like domain-containing protein [Sulfitobacter sabulilitoris]
MKSETLENGTLDNMTPQEVSAAMARNEIVLIDVRTPQEFALERIRGALLAPMQSFDAGHLPTGSRQRIVLHCGSGIRSKKVAQMMLAAGVDRVAHLEGGFGAWKSAGLPYIGTDPATGGPKDMKAAS